MSFRTVTKPQKKNSTVTMANAAGYFLISPAFADGLSPLIFTIVWIFPFLRYIAEPDTVTAPIFEK
jgi:hypothetical protein